MQSDLFDQEPGDAGPPDEEASLLMSGEALADLPKARDYSLKVRPVVNASLNEHHDALGRKQPKPPGSSGILAVAMRCGMPPPTDVPGEFWNQDVNDDGFSCAVIACPCGEEPHIEVGCLQPCQPTCGRYFFFAGDRVVVWRVPEADRQA